MISLSTLTFYYNCAGTEIEPDYNKDADLANISPANNSTNVSVISGPVQQYIDGFKAIGGNKTNDYVIDPNEMINRTLKQIRLEYLITLMEQTFQKALQ